MCVIAYCQPFVPPEWIAAHRLRPRWLRLRSNPGGDASAHHGVCPVAGTLVDIAFQVLPTTAAAVVLTTACDQMRYAAALLEQSGKVPVFLMHVPKTWQTEAAAQYYQQELQRLGRFLVAHGGTVPTSGVLRETMLRYDRARRELRGQCHQMSYRKFSEAVAWVRGEATSGMIAHAQRTVPFSSDENWDSPLCDENRDSLHTRERANGRVRLALVGGPMLEDDVEVLAAAERAGGRIVLDATESGERTLPVAFDAERLKTDPLQELARAYFQAIPDVFRRPNDDLYRWLWPRVAECGARGLIVRRHVWCDLWHAELPRLRQESPVPVLEWNPGGDAHAAAGAIGRLEAFLETLR